MASWWTGASAKVHILTHALHYASSVFEGERCYNGKIFKSATNIPNGCCNSGELLDMPIPYTVDEIDAAKEATLKANGLTDAYVRAIAWRGAGEDMGVASPRNPIRLAVACWTWGSYYGDAKIKGAKLDIAKWKRPSPETIPHRGQGRRSLHDLHHVQARGRGQGLLGRDDVRLSRLCGRGDRAPTSSSSRTARCTRPMPDCFLNGITRQTVIGMLKDMQIKVHERHIMPEELEGFEQCWLTGTAAEVTPVGQIGDYNFEVGAPDARVATEYEKLVRA